MTFSSLKELDRDFESITFHHLFERPHPDHSPEQDQADFLSFVAAHADSFLFNYNFLLEELKRRSTSGLPPLEPPTPVQFLERFWNSSSFGLRNANVCSLAAMGTGSGRHRGRQSHHGMVMSLAATTIRMVPLSRFAPLSRPPSEGF